MYNQLDVLHSAELNLKHHLEDRTQGGRETCDLKKKIQKRGHGAAWRQQVQIPGSAWVGHELHRRASWSENRCGRLICVAQTGCALRVWAKGMCQRGWKCKESWTNYENQARGRHKIEEFSSFNSWPELQNNLAAKFNTYNAGTEPTETSDFPSFVFHRKWSEVWFVVHMWMWQENGNAVNFNHFLSMWPRRKINHSLYCWWSWAAISHL